MRYFVPEIAPSQSPVGDEGSLRRFFSRGSTASVDEQVSEEKLGGIPYGLPPRSWPKCKICGKSQSFLAQMKHDVGRLELGREGRTLFVFQCDHDPGMCETWEADAGANACLIVEPENLNHSFASVPDDDPPIENGVNITGWLSKEDGISPDARPLFFNQDAYDTLDEETVQKATFSTRLGGVPAWIQSPDDAPKPNWRFLGQLDSMYSFLTPPQSSKKWISEDKSNYEGRTHIGEGPNFGDMGIAYLFAKEVDGQIQVKMFWQCS